MKSAINTTQKRLTILGDNEIQAFYGLPHFTPEERIQYFALSQTEKDLLAELRSVRSKTCFILQLGYFKAKHLFFSFDFTEVCEDVGYILGQYFPDVKIDNLRAVDKRTRRNQRRLILELCNYRLCDAEERQKLEAKARQAAIVCSKPIYIFRELMDYLQEQRIVAPGYSFMQDTVGKALNFEQDRLRTIVRNHLDISDIEALKSLLSDSQSLYEITLLKREANQTRQNAIFMQKATALYARKPLSVANMPFGLAARTLKDKNAYLLTATSFWSIVCCVMD